MIAWGAFLGRSSVLAADHPGFGLLLSLLVFGVASSAVGLIARRALGDRTFRDLYPAMIGAAVLVGTLGGHLGAEMLRMLTLA